MERLVLGGVELSTVFDVVGVVRPLPIAQPNLELIPGRDGYAVKGMDYVPGEISFTLVSRSADARQRRLDASLIASTVYTREPVEVSFGSDDGLSYMAIASGEMEVMEHVKSGASTILMQQVDAAMYGATRTIMVPSGSSVTFLVGGTYRTKPIIDANWAVRDSQSNVWGLRLDEGKYVHVLLPTSNVTKVVLDCAERTCSVGGAVSLPTLDSDWLELEPGEHTLRMDKGTNSSTTKVTFRERWLR